MLYNFYPPDLVQTTTTLPITRTRSNARACHFRTQAGLGKNWVTEFPDRKRLWTEEMFCCFSMAVRRFLPVPVCFVRLKTSLVRPRRNRRIFSVVEGLVILPPPRNNILWKRGHKTTIIGNRMALLSISSFYYFYERKAQMEKGRVENVAHCSDNRTVRSSGRNWGLGRGYVVLTRISSSLYLDSETGIRNGSRKITP
jgi:hypothetical protein